MHNHGVILCSVHIYTYTYEKRACTNVNTDPIIIVINTCRIRPENQQPGFKYTLYVVYSVLFYIEIWGYTRIMAKDKQF